MSSLSSRECHIKIIGALEPEMGPSPPETTACLYDADDNAGDNDAAVDMVDDE